MAAAHKERTFIAVKPDGVQRCLIGDITKRFEQRGYKLVAAKLCKVWSVPAMSDRNVITIFFLLTGIWYTVQSTPEIGITHVAAFLEVGLLQGVKEEKSEMPCCKY